MSWHVAMELPPGRPAYGKTYGAWSAAWWQWAYSIPVPSNPLFDSTGVLCGTRGKASGG